MERRLAEAGRGAVTCGITMMLDCNESRALCAQGMGLHTDGEGNEFKCCFAQREPRSWKTTVCFDHIRDHDTEEWSFGKGNANNYDLQ